MNNIGALISQFQSFMQNPAQLLMQRGLPQNALQNPREAVQQLMNSGQLSQQQFNQLQAAANNIISNPLFRQMFGRNN